MYCGFWLHRPFGLLRSIQEEKVTKKVMVGTPTFSGQVDADYQSSMTLSMFLAMKHGWYVQTNILQCCSLISYGRAIIAQDFMDSDCDVLFFLDSDMGWDPRAFVEYLEAPLEVMGGAYPIKREGPVSFHIELKEQFVSDGTGRRILLETTGVGGGFVKVTRSAIEKMQKAYPELKVTAPYGGQTRELYMLWDTLNVNGVPKGEDLSFCYRWTSLGEKIYVDPNITFKHWGRKCWEGNFQRDIMEKVNGNDLANDNEDRNRPNKHNRNKKRRHDDRPVLGSGTVQPDKPRRSGGRKVGNLERNSPTNGSAVKEN